MRFLSGFLLGLLLQPILRLFWSVVALLLIATVVMNALGQTTPARAAERATIVRAVDGDTLLVRTAGAQERVRVLGIDTPETVKPDTAVQRCGPEASARAKAWATAHRIVTLARDPAAPNRDRYSRLLRYVRPTDDGRDLSMVQVAAGLARVKAYGQDLEQLPALKAAERRAKTAHRGLWGTSCTTP